MQPSFSDQLLVVNDEDRGRNVVVETVSVWCHYRNAVCGVMGVWKKGDVLCQGVWGSQRSGLTTRSASSPEGKSALVSEHSLMLSLCCRDWWRKSKRRVEFLWICFCCDLSLSASFEAKSNSWADHMAFLNNKSSFLVFFSFQDPKELDSAPLCSPFLSLVQG